MALKIGKKKLSLRMPAQYNLLIHVCILILCAFGTTMLLSVSSQDAVFDTMGSLKTLMRQTVFLVGGYILMVLLSRYFTLEAARKYGGILMIAGISMIAVTFLFPNQYGIRAWITIPLPNPLPNITIQPSELIKLFAIIYLAGYWGNLPNSSRFQLKDVVQAPALFLGAAAILVLKQPDFGSFAILAMLVGILTLFPIHPVMRGFQNTVWMLIVVVGSLALFLMSPLGIGIVKHLPFFSAYQIQRFELAVNPFAFNHSDGYQIVNGLVAFFTGGWTGVGLGKSTHKYGYVPAAKTDSILPIIVEELGMLGFALIFIPYVILLYQIFKYAMKIRSTAARMLLIGVASYFFIHFALNVGGVTGLIPMTGVPLIFISQGGSSTLTGMMAIGVVQAVIASYKRGEIQ